MNSTIIWMLIIQMHGGYCMESVAIAFQTESACEAALSGVDADHRKTAKCEPKKESK